MLAMMNDQQLAAESDNSVCSGYGYSRRMVGNSGGQRLKTEIERRHLVPASEWPIIERTGIQIGMTECGFLASWGPIELDAVNRTVNAAGTRLQYVYRGAGGGKARYVYVENGKVTAFQD